MDSAFYNGPHEHYNHTLDCILSLKIAHCTPNIVFFVANIGLRTLRYFLYNQNVV